MSQPEASRPLEDNPLINNVAFDEGRDGAEGRLYKNNDSELRLVRSFTVSILTYSAV